MIVYEDRTGYPLDRTLRPGQPHVPVNHVIPAEGRRRPGRPKKLSDAELVCLAVAQVLLGAH